MYKSKLITNNNHHDSISGKTIVVTSPWDMQPLGEVAAATKEEAFSSVYAANDAFACWSKTGIRERADIMRKAVALIKQNADSISELLSREIGKTKEDAHKEVMRSLDYTELTIEAMNHLQGRIYYGDVMPGFKRNRKTGYYQRVPLGVVLAIAPFNYPINLSITKVAPALISGNSVVLKPPTQGALASYEFYKYFTEAGLPSGVLNFITGSSSEIGDTLITHESVKLIAFTGSTGVGNHIRSAANGVPLLLELGGKDIAIVTDKADLDLAASEITAGAFAYAGQRCTAQKLILVYDSVANTLTSKVVELARQLELNPMINNEAADYVMDLIGDALGKGAHLALEGSRDGNKLKPNILDKVTAEMRIFNEEQFGPLMPIVRVSGEEDAISKAGTSCYGLQASVFTQDIEEAYRIADKLDAGTVQINAKPDRGPDNFPFGGVKDSGQFMQGTIETIELMTRGKLTVLNLHKS